jgi:transporter family protein
MWAIFAFSSSLLAGINTILQKETLKKLHAVQLMTVSTIVVAVACLGFLPFYNFSVDFRQISLIALFTIMQAFALIFTIRAMRHLDVSVVSPFFNLGTALTAVMAYFFFKEALTSIDIAGIFLLIAGGYILELKGKNLAQPIKEVFRSSSIHYLLGGVLLFSTGYLLSKFILETMQPIPFLVYQQMGNLIIFSAITFFVYGGTKDIKQGFADGKWLIPAMAVLLILENLFMYKALKTGEASLVVPLYRTWTLWAVIFGGRVFHENHLLKRTIASVLMILGAAIILI